MPTAADICPEVGAVLATLERFAPAAARRASHALAAALERWFSAPDGPHTGKLVAGGFPVEFVFTTLDSAIRYTVEVGGPGVAPDRRLGIVEGQLAELPAPRGFPLKNLQDGTLRWGAWLGGRHSTEDDSYKIYVEAGQPLGESARIELGATLGPHGTILDSHMFALRMAGWEAASGRLELYFRGRDLQPRELAGLMRFAGVGDREGELLALLEDACQQPVRVRLPGARQGFSITVSPAGVIQAFTLFTFASSLFGDEAASRRKLLALTSRRGWNFEMYAAVTRALSRRHAPHAHHGIVSFIVPRTGAAGVAVGVRPPIILSSAKASAP